ncbi:MAG TPA: undecaprenyl-phosphate glucose phosphotransferase [Chloroflexota bacterium]|nr:undecaprenyl-phosphate glucose phosphotransferase [Chloroflexota bacterium]
MEAVGDSVSPPTATGPGLSTSAPASQGAGPRRRGRRYALLARLSVLLIDALAVNAAFFLAYQARYVLGLGGEVADENFVEYAEYWPLQLALVGLTLLFFHLRGLYKLARGTAWFDEVLSVAGGSLYAVGLLFAAVSLVRYPATSRLTFIYAWLLIVLLVAAGRSLVRGLRALARRRGLGIARVLVVGDNSAGRMIMQSIADQPHLGYQVAGFVALEPGPDFGRFRRLGTLAELPTVCAQHAIDEVIIALPAAYHHKVLEVRDYCQRQGLSFKLVPDLYELSLNRVELDAINGIPLLSVKETAIHGWNLFTKRAMDVVIASIGLTLFAPLWLLIALAIRLDSPGPVLFRQERVGRGGTRFYLLKFRSMRQDADRIVQELLAYNEATGPLFKMRNDPRLTRVGRVLRRWSLDEWPQLWNVLKGEMSLVGPRPPLPREVEQYEPWHYRRLEVSPGITGLWQVSGRSELSFDEMVMLDLYYIENWSLGLDLRILLRTIPAVFRGRGAY